MSSRRPWPAPQHIQAVPNVTRDPLLDLDTNLSVKVTSVGSSLGFACSTPTTEVPQKDQLGLWLNMETTMDSALSMSNPEQQPATVATAVPQKDQLDELTADGLWFDMQSSWDSASSANAHTQSPDLVTNPEQLEQPETEGTEGPQMDELKRAETEVTGEPQEDEPEVTVGPLEDVLEPAQTAGDAAQTEQVPADSAEPNSNVAIVAPMPRMVADDGGPLEEEEEWYEVEKILACKVMHGVRRYLLKWEGYGDESNSWEREVSLNCDELLAEFKQEQLAKQKHWNKRSAKDRSVEHQAEYQASDDAGTSSPAAIEPPAAAVAAATEPPAAVAAAVAWSPTIQPSRMFIVEQIVRMKQTITGRRDFLVHWAGFDVAHRTWVREENMRGNILLAEFMAKYYRELETKPKPKKRRMH